MAPVSDKVLLHKQFCRIPTVRAMTREKWGGVKISCSKSDFVFTHLFVLFIRGVNANSRVRSFGPSFMVLMVWHRRFAKSPCSRPQRPREKQGVHGALTLLALFTMLLCTETSDIPGLSQGLQLAVPSHRRELQTAVSTSAGLTSALANPAVSRIVLASGTYNLFAELSITRSVILEAAAGATVTLNAQASSSSPRRVLNINPGSLGVVQLVGLRITGGYLDRVRRSCSIVPIAPMGKLLTRLHRLSLAQLRPTLRSTTVLCTCRRDSL